MSAGTTTHESRKLLRGVSWQDYVALRDNDEYRNTRMTFDRGSLELMSPGRLHERLRIVIGKCVEAWCREMLISYQSCGSTTFRREDLERGLEPDNCYYIQNLAVVKDRAAELDLTIEPPPDLILEVDVTSSSLDKMSIYAALGVPEVWRWDDDRLQVCGLDSGGSYVNLPESPALPGFPIAVATEFVNRRTFADELLLVDEFREIIRAVRKRSGQDP
jgi:Uma2 family endonuclease